MSAGGDASPACSRSAAAAVALLATALRLPWLNRLPLAGDEDLSFLAARSLARHGIPSLPSGALYWRGPLYHALAAPLAALDVDWLPRLLSVLAAMGTAWLLVRRAHVLVGRNAALLSGLIYAVSLVEIAFGRQLRMYALYQLAALGMVLTLAAAWERRQAAALAWPALLAVVAAGLHQIAGSLGALFFVVSGRFRRWGATLTALALGPLLILLTQLQWQHAHTALRAGLEAVPQPGPATDGTSNAAMLLRLLPLGDWSPPATVALLAAAGLALVLGWTAWTAGAAGPGRLPAALLAAAAGGLAGLHQAGAAVALLAVLALLQRELLDPQRAPRTLLSLAASVGAVTLAWTAAGWLSGVGVRALAADLAGRSLARFAQFLLIWPPAITLPAAVGAAALLWLSLRGRAPDGPRWILAAVLILVTGRALLARKWQVRYILDIWLLWELLAAWTLVQGIGLARSFLAARGAPHRARLVPASVLGVVLLLGPGTGLPQTVKFLARQPGDPPPARLTAAETVADIRGACAWLRPRLSPGDRIAATDWIATQVYCGQVDFWLRSGGWVQQSGLVNGEPRDLYLGARVLPGPGDLDAVSRQGPVWVVAGGAELESPDPRKLSPAYKAMLLAAPPLHTAADGRTRVLRMGGSDE